MPEGTSQIGEADGVAAGQILSIPVQVSDLPANTIHTLTVRKVDANDVETVLTLDRTYELKITEDY